MRLEVSSTSIPGRTSWRAVEGLGTVEPHRFREIDLGDEGEVRAVEDGELDARPLLTAVVEARRRGRDVAEIARAFHRGLAEGIQQGIMALAEKYGSGMVVLSGGVFQNELLLEDLKAFLGSFAVWTNRDVPPNDGGISLGQAVLTR